MNYDEPLPPGVTQSTLDRLDLSQPILGLSPTVDLTLCQLMSICEQQYLQADLERMFTRTLPTVETATALMPLQAALFDEEERTSGRLYRRARYLTKQIPGAEIKTLRLPYQPDALVCLRTDSPIYTLQFQVTPHELLIDRDEFLTVLSSSVLNFDHICETTLPTRESIKVQNKITHHDARILALRYNNLRLWTWLTYVNDGEAIILASDATEAPRQYRTQKLSRKIGRTIKWI